MDASAPPAPSEISERGAPRESPEGRPPPSPPGRGLLLTAAFVVVVAGLRAAAPVVQPVLLALFVAILSFPMLDGLRRRRVPTWAAILLTVVADLALLSILGYLLSGSVDEFARAAPRYIERLEAMVLSGLAALEARGIVASEWVALEPIDPQRLVEVAGNLVGGTVRGVASALSFFTLVVVALVFVLLELVDFRAKLRLALGHGDPTHHFDAIRREIQRYLGIKTALSLVTGVVLGIWVALIGLDFPVFWGLAAFLLNYVPVIGPIIAGVPAVLFALVQLGWVKAMILGAGYLLVKVVIGDLVEPHLMGRRFGLSTLVVFVSLLFWGWMWGPLGMILSVPLTMTLKIALDQSDRTRWAAVLLGPAPEA